MSAVSAISIWAIFLVGTRSVVNSTFSVEEILVLRLLTASIFTCPIMLKMGILLRGQSFFATFVLTIGVSALFPYTITTGLSYASASDAGALAPGTIPFWTTLFSFFILGEKPDRLRIVGLVLIFSGAVFVSLWQISFRFDSEAWKGHLLFLLAALLWSTYSVYFRQSGLHPLHSLVIGLFWGTLALLPFLYISGRVNFSNASIQDIIAMAILQGILIGVLALVLYTVAVRSLGAAQTGAFAALTPVFALVGGATFLDETITFSKLFGISLVALGVLLASGALCKQN